MYSGKAVASAVLHESFQGSPHHRWLAGSILDRQLGGDGTFHRRMGLRGRHPQLSAEGRIGGCRAWVQGQAQQHHQILRAQDKLRV